MPSCATRGGIRPASFLCVRLGRSKGRSYGWVLGLCFGWLGVIVLLCLPKTFDAKVRDEREREQIRQAAQEPAPPPWPRTIPGFAQKPPPDEPKLPRLVP